MPTTITVRRGYRAPALIDFQTPDFEHWYTLGVFWAMYGDEQGKGPYKDTYLMTNVTNDLKKHRYDDPASEWFTMLGFNFGMLHSGMLDPITRSVRSCGHLVVLTNLNFTKDYQAGRYGYFFESLPSEEPLQESHVREVIHECAIGPLELDCLYYVLGCFVGRMSGEVIPLGESDYLEPEIVILTPGYSFVV